MRPLNQKEITRRYHAWLELVDFSARLAMAGMKTQGLSRIEAWEICCRRWARACAQHQRANRKIVQELHARDPLPKPNH